MMIDKIGGINPLNSVQNTRRSNGAAQVRSDADSISVSNEAKETCLRYLFLSKESFIEIACINLKVTPTPASEENG